MKEIIEKLRALPEKYNQGNQLVAVKFMLFFVKAPIESSCHFELSQESFITDCQKLEAALSCAGQFYEGKNVTDYEAAKQKVPTFREKYQQLLRAQADAKSALIAGIYAYNSKHGIPFSPDPSPTAGQ
ncbi:MAG: hypothetical protein K0Q57_942 [Gammaproteobacteria bacterium]|jgi:hypothetical protein|nr:hypothetical protein [Gammaproteobacteria bacterium]